MAYYNFLVFGGQVLSFKNKALLLFAIAFAPSCFLLLPLRKSTEVCIAGLINKSLVLLRTRYTLYFTRYILHIIFYTRKIN